MKQHPARNTHIAKALVLLLLLLAAWACSPTRRLKPGEKLLTKVVIEKDDKNLSESDVKSYLRQVPNRKLFGFWRFYLQIYNLADPAKADADSVRKYNRINDRHKRREANRNERCDKRRQRTGKECKPKSFDDEISAKPFRKWIQGVGEAPVIFDSTKQAATISEVKQSLFNMGYFFATIKDSVVTERYQRVTVYYKIKTGHRYKLDTIKYECNDSLISQFVNEDKEEKLVLQGQYFDTDKIAAERDRVTKMLKNKGYFFFNNEYIKIDADTANKNYTCDLLFAIKNPMVPTGKTGADSLIESRHTLYRLRNIYVNIASDVTQENFAGYVKDTTFKWHKNYYADGKHRIPRGFKPYERVTFTYEKGKAPYRPKTLLYHIFVKTGQRYSDDSLDVTVSRLSDLRNFKFVNVQYKEYKGGKNTQGEGLLDAFVNLTPTLRRSYAIETQGTNTGGNLGIGGSFSYINKNLFRGEEYLEFKIRGALEFQRQVNNNIIGDDSEIPLFNTQEYGASISLNIPRGVFPIHYFVKDPVKNPRTAITASYVFQARPQYSRNVYGLTLGWTWKQNKHMYVTYNPVEFNFLNARLDPLYQANLPLVILRSFDNTFIDAGRVSLVWTNQVSGKRKNYVFWRLGAESAGLLLNAVGLNQINFQNTTIKTAQYLRADFEMYPNFYLNDRNALAFRIYGGVGLPLDKDPLQNPLPFAKAFFSGGSNGMRAWQQRGLGPGGYDKSSNTNIDQVGDIKIEFNIEYRLKLLSFLEPALFMDIGNVWLMNNDVQRVGGKFSKDFYKQFGINYGVGFRIDLSFFLLRIDCARRLIDPGAEYGNTYLSPFEYVKYIPPGETSPTRKNPIIFQLGIGYPF